ncbi:MAG TPA: hypothetical protein VFU13_12105 [Steroidobacteraceae bacterium]|nr:hypothetical protein [Steroidobacteraceae bacterium]
MNNNRYQAAALPLLALILMVFSPLAFSSEPDAVIEATGEGLTYLEVGFRSREGKELAQYHFKGSDGLIVGSVALPGEAGAQYEITAFDADGIATYSGKGLLPGLIEGDRPRLLSLPGTEPEKGGNGLVISLSRERLVLEAKPMDDPNSFYVWLEAFDPRGDRLKLDPKEVSWGLTDPTHFEIDRLGEFEIVVRPRETFPRPVGDLCDVPPKVVLCIPDLNCRVVSICPDPWAQLSAGVIHTCALTKSGAAYCWGANNQGQLGAPTTTTCGSTSRTMCSTRPLRVECPAGAPCRFTQIASGETLTVAIDTNGDTWWWGRGAPAHHKVSATLRGKPIEFSSIAAGYGHGCGIGDGALFCWGSNGFGSAGAPLVMREVSDQSPVHVLPTIEFSKVVGGSEHTCAVTSRATDVVCWGRDTENQTTGPNPAQHGQFFFQNFGTLVSIVDLALSHSSSCVTLAGSGVNCWGDHLNLDVAPFGVPESLAVGHHHVCAVSSQKASCVGGNNWGELGTNSTALQASPVPVHAPPALVSTISAGTNHTCGLTPTGEIYCWGRNHEGEVGDGSAPYNVTGPTLVTTP